MNKQDIKQRTIVIFGVSKGLGKAIVQELAAQQNTKIYGISRSKPDYLDSTDNVHWICADLATPTQAMKAVEAQVGEQTIDSIIYNVGIWEYHAFSDAYAFEETDTTELLTMVQTNISSCLLAMHCLLPNLKQSQQGKVILIGSTWGLDNHKGKEVTFSATKFALRGMVHALRENLREDKIGVSILNLGYLATAYDRSVPIATVYKETEGKLIPLQDVLLAIQFILATSSATCVKEITMPAMADENV